MNDSYKNTNKFIIKQAQLTLPLGNQCQAIQVVKYDLNQYKDSLYSTFDIEQPNESKQWLDKRKAQFLAGRFATRQALKVISTKNETIHIGKHREPLWGENIVGSISHGNGMSIATAQIKTSPNQSIGLDIQAILSDQEISDSAIIVLTPNDEKVLTKEDHTYSYNQLFTLLFSAKESFFKAAFQEVGEYFDFDVMSLKSIDIESQTLVLICEKTLSNNIISDSEFSLNFSYLEMTHSVFITYCVFPHPK